MRITAFFEVAGSVLTVSVAALSKTAENYEKLARRAEHPHR
ncbi:hypothetical protein [Bradyrhizobium sp. UFLA05-112]